jgi:transcriptional regulator with XRE-family HTH domain
MLADLRKQARLTRQELADQTHRSVGYILKAEQATFPSPPIALVNYWVKQGHDKDVLLSAYRDKQRYTRRQWLETWAPKYYSSKGLPFRQKWIRRRAGAVGFFHSSTGFVDELGVEVSGVEVNPTSYAVSVGLCIPAAVVYRNDKDLTKAGAIVTAMEDLCEYVLSGEYAAQEYGEEGLMATIDSVVRIAMEEGVKNAGGSSSNSEAA